MKAINFVLAAVFFVFFMYDVAQLFGAVATGQPAGHHAIMAVLDAALVALNSWMFSTSN
jgi:hypothetical protein